MRTDKPTDSEAMAVGCVALFVFTLGVAWVGFMAWMIYWLVSWLVSK